MIDIFISYARSDREKAKAIADALEQRGYKVWWDPKIPPGKKFDEVIEEVLSQAKCVVVLWSQESIRSDWVKEEANVGKRRGILLPAKIEPVNPPLGFGLIQAADLTDWAPHQPHEGFSALVEAITNVAGAPETKKTGEAQPVKSEPDFKRVVKAPEVPTAITNSIGMEFVLIPEGSFTMGSRMTSKELVDRFGGEKEWYGWEKPHHAVKIERPFYLQSTPVTQGQWQRVMGNNPSKFKDCGDGCPVEQVSWEEAQAFIKKLNQAEKTKDYRLPSEAEWEYSCRAGSETEFPFGDDAKRLGEFAWFGDNSGGKTHPVGEKKPNALGLYDMHGNVWEWMEDDYHGSYERAPDDGKAWIDKQRRSDRVIRGGGWNTGAPYCRSAARNGNWPGNRRDYVGFRVSRSVALGP